jgi:hypothetical protein
MYASPPLNPTSISGVSVAGHVECHEISLVHHRFGCESSVDLATMSHGHFDKDGDLPDQAFRSCPSIREVSSLERPGLKIDAPTDILSVR